MKRKGILLLMMAAAALIFTVPASADTVGEIYSQQSLDSGLGEVYEGLDAQAAEILNNIGADPKSGNLPDIKAGSVFGEIFELLKTGYRKPLTVSLSIAGVLILLSLTAGLKKSEAQGGITDFAAAVCVAGMAMIPLYETLETAVSALKGSATFMLSLVPVYGSILIASGQTATAGGSGALLLGAAEAVAQCASFALAPMMGVYLAVSVAASVSPLVSAGGIAEVIKKTVQWALAAVLTLFIAVLGIQTAVSSSIDNTSYRAARFLSGSIPLVGGAVGETVSVVKSSLILLGRSAGAYGVVAVAAILVPIIIELVLWRIGMAVCAATGEMLNNPRMTGLIRAVDAVYGFLLGVLIYTLMLFIISMAVVMLAGGDT